MKRTVELDTIEIADALNDCARQADLLALAVTGQGQLDLDTGVDAIAGVALSLASAIRKVSDTVLPNGGGDTK